MPPAPRRVKRRGERARLPEGKRARREVRRLLAAALGVLALEGARGLDGGRVGHVDPEQDRRGAELVRARGAAEAGRAARTGDYAGAVRDRQRRLDPVLDSDHAVEAVQKIAEDELLYARVPVRDGAGLPCVRPGGSHGDVGEVESEIAH